MTEDHTLSWTVVDAVASADGRDPSDLSQPLHTVVDPDALDSLFRADAGRVVFQYHGYRVTAAADGEVDVEPVAAD